MIFVHIKLLNVIKKHKKENVCGIRPNIKIFTAFSFLAKQVDLESNSYLCPTKENNLEYLLDLSFSLGK